MCKENNSTLHIYAILHPFFEISINLPLIFRGLDAPGFRNSLVTDCLSTLLGNLYYKRTCIYTKKAYVVTFFVLNVQHQVFLWYFTIAPHMRVIVSFLLHLDSLNMDSFYPHYHQNVQQYVLFVLVFLLLFIISLSLVTCFYKNMTKLVLTTVK